MLNKKQREAEAAAAAASSSTSSSSTPSSSAASSSVVGNGIGGHERGSWSGAVPISLPVGTKGSSSSMTSTGAGPASGNSSSSGNCSPTAGVVVHPHPYRHPLLPPGNYDEEYPLRKTGEFWKIHSKKICIKINNSNKSNSIQFHSKI